ncbi:MAG: large conductance mechanosensitive channel protein MscL [Coriobacteriales bacterium]|jgi:large conductance mechanosensitive channel|nr:large conductance mechanosensitive channel protein MscL [Coriobacteriales bacterium]
METFVHEEDTVKIMREFRDFVSRGNVMDLAVAVIMGAAFTAIINSLVTDIITPILSLVTGGYDFSKLMIQIGSGDHAAQLTYGSFIAAVINFLSLSLVVFFFVKALNKISSRRKEEAPATKSCPYCTQDIPEAAVRCPACTTVLDPAAVPRELR